MADDQTSSQQNPQQPQQAAPQQALQHHPNAEGAAYPLSSKDASLFKVAFIFCIVSMIGIVAAMFQASMWCAVAFAWSIPITVHCHKIATGQAPNTTGFGVVTLLFVSLISGICLLCGTKTSK